MEDNFVGGLKPLKGKGGISQDWLPTPETIGVPQALQKEEKGGFFRDLWGGVKDAAKKGFDDVKRDPIGALSNIAGSLRQQDISNLQNNLTSSDPNRQEWAIQEIARLRAELDAQQQKGLNVGGFKISTTSIIIAVFILLFIIIIATRK